MRGVRICCFSSGIDEMKKKDQEDPVKVLAVLKCQPRFSAFEASANRGIARSITFLFERNLVENVGDLGYPWVKVRITELGQSVLSGASPLPPPPDPFEGMVRVSRREWVSESIAKKYNLKKYEPEVPHVD
jgi:hypothetical protein